MYKSNVHFHIFFYYHNYLYISLMSTPIRRHLLTASGKSSSFCRFMLQFFLTIEEKLYIFYSVFIFL